MKRFLSCSAAAAASLLLISSAAAHVHLDSPTVRYPDAADDPNGSDVQKVGPCGVAGGERTDRVTTLLPGSTITVQITEQIAHPGYFRIAFDDDGDDGFVDPVDPDDVDNVADGTNGIVLLDHWLQKPGKANPDAPDERAAEEDLTYETAVTLPDIECDGCTLQVLQIMTDKNDPGVPFDGNDIYYRCADLVLSVDAPDAGADPGMPDAGADPTGPDAGGDPVNPADPNAGVSGGCAAGGGAGGSGLLLLGLGLIALRRRTTALR